jgi:lycopene cyclase domain-containing protein
MTILSPIWGFFFDTDAVTSGLWFFNQHFSLGIEILGLPVEEWIFLFVVPQELTAILLIIKQYVGDNKR